MIGSLFFENIVFSFASTLINFHYFCLLLRAFLFLGNTPIKQILSCVSFKGNDVKNTFKIKTIPKYCQLLENDNIN